MATILDKIIHKNTGKFFDRGEFAEINVDRAMVHDGTIVLTKKYFDLMKVNKVWDPDKIFVIFDHNFPPANEQVAELQCEAREFIRQQGIRKFFEGEGVCHQILLEQNEIKPGQIVLGADSHTSTIGALGAIGIGIGATDMAYIFATGKTWIKIPETIGILLKGNVRPRVSAKDVFLHLAKILSCSGALYKALVFQSEFTLPMSWRATLCNMGIEVGAKTALFEPDKETARLRNVSENELLKLRSDTVKEFNEFLEINLEDISPLIACPSSVDKVCSVKEISRKIDVAFIGTCTGGRYDDLQDAAEVLRGKKIKKDVRLLVCPASQTVYKKAMEDGMLKILVDAGAIILTTGCGPCLGLHSGALAKGEVCISTANRNFIGRMGSRDAEIYLASSRTVAASAIAGVIKDSGEFL